MFSQEHCTFLFFNQSDRDSATKFIMINNTQNHDHKLQTPKKGIQIIMFLLFFCFMWREREKTWSVCKHHSSINRHHSISQFDDECVHLKIHERRAKKNTLIILNSSYVREKNENTKKKFFSESILNRTRPK